MFRRFQRNPVTNFSSIIFFIFLSDAIISFWVPNFLQNYFNNNALLMGVVLSFSSLVGIIFDFTFPQFISKVTSTKLIFFSFLISILVGLSLLLGIFRPMILIFLISMGLWGIYYEFLGFADKEFVAHKVPLEEHSSAWAVISLFKSLAYFLGPAIAGWLFIRNENSPIFIAISFSIIGLFIFFSLKRTKEKEVSLNFKEFNLFSEFKHWAYLFKYVWPILILSFILWLIDCMFWTTGAVLGLSLTQKSFWGALFLPFYTLPSLIIWYPIAKVKISHGKKKRAIICIATAGVFLVLLGLFDKVFWNLAMVFLASTFLGIAFPFLDATYSDIIERVGKGDKHLIGMSNSIFSLSYIVGPIFAGFLVKISSESSSFSIMGIITIIVSLVLLLVTPKKLLVPKVEINKWEKHE